MRSSLRFLSFVSFQSFSWFYILNYAYAALTCILIHASTNELYISTSIITTLACGTFHSLFLYNTLSLSFSHRATLLLVPLLGLQYMLTPFRPDPGHPWETTYQVISAFTASFQVSNSFAPFLPLPRSAHWAASTQVLRASILFYDLPRLKHFTPLVMQISVASNPAENTPPSPLLIGSMLANNKLRLCQWAKLLKCQAQAELGAASRQIQINLCQCVMRKSTRAAWAGYFSISLHIKWAKPSDSKRWEDKAERTSKCSGVWSERETAAACKAEAAKP